MNNVTKTFLGIVGKGFKFDQNKDLSMVNESNDFLDSLSLQERVDLIDGLDIVLEGNKTIKRRFKK